MSAGRSNDRTAKTGGFKPSDRLLDGRDFQRVLRAGRRRSLPELVVVTTATRTTGRSDARGAGRGAHPGPTSRLGITVGRKAGPSVQRNRFKRRVREWFRHHRGELATPVDIVVIARRPAVDLSLAELGDRLSRLLGLSKSEARSEATSIGRPEPMTEVPGNTQDSRSL